MERFQGRRCALGRITRYPRMCVASFARIVGYSTTSHPAQIYGTHRTFRSSNLPVAQPAQAVFLAEHLPYSHSEVSFHYDDIAARHYAIIHDNVHQFRDISI